MSSRTSSTDIPAVDRACGYFPAGSLTTFVTNHGGGAEFAAYAQAVSSAWMIGPKAERKVLLITDTPNDQVSYDLDLTGLGAIPATNLVVHSASGPAAISEFLTAELASDRQFSVILIAGLSRYRKQYQELDDLFRQLRNITDTPVVVFWQAPQCSSDAAVYTANADREEFTLGGTWAPRLGDARLVTPADVPSSLLLMADTIVALHRSRTQNNPVAGRHLTDTRAHAYLLKSRDSSIDFGVYDVAFDVNPFTSRLWACYRP